MSDDMRIVPERDEIRARSSSKVKKKPVTSGSKTSPVSGRKPSSSQASQSIGGLTWMLCVLVVILVGFSAFLFIQVNSLENQRNLLANRVADIESKLSVTDESLSQSGAAMQAVLREQGDELELHMSEIRKLWAVAYDRNRVDIASLGQDLKDVDARLNSMSSSVSGLDPIIQGYDGMQSRMETIASQLLVQSATLDELSARARELADKNVSTDSLNSAQATKLNEHEEAIDAIDEYRLQINQRLRRLEQSLVPSTPAEG